jgi:hypothetical protein
MNPSDARSKELRTAASCRPRETDRDCRRARPSGWWRGFCTLRVSLVGLLVVGLAAQTRLPRLPAPSLSSITHFGARPDAAGDGTEAIQRGIDAAAVHAGVVQNPVSELLMMGHRVLAPGARRTGIRQAGLQCA